MEDDNTKKTNSDSPRTIDHHTDEKDYSSQDQDSYCNWVDVESTKI